MSRRTLPWSALLGPFAIRAWHDAVFVAAGAVYLALPGFGIALGYDYAYDRASLDTLAVLCLIAALPWILPLANRAQRSRFWSLRGVDLRIVPLYQASSTQPGARVRPGWRALGSALRSGAARRQITYHFAASPCFALAGIGLLIAWPFALAMALMPLYFTLLTPASDLRHALWVPFKPVPAPVGFTAFGIALLWILPMLTHAVAVLDTRIATRLLGPDRERELEQRVAGLTESRSALVQAADAERRRIERDLHDGAQQRLVSLAINLGMARATLDGVPPQAMEVITAAHEEAKSALAEMRDLVRGLHPAVLDDRGLDAALSGIAARAPFPVRLTVDVPERPAPAVEAVAYFVVSEALANIAKHAQANEARIDVERMRGRLWIRIRDDGVGGADPGRGSGLAGLARRAASVDGSFHLSSPAGGPTVISVELPCEP
ncbi:MAG TPA: sensor histidine kinase [Actinocrinis sp.]|nr:sensor histidine kinase [Actinocrinis sp.]